MRRFGLLVVTLLVVSVFGAATTVLADKPAEGRAGRSEVRFLEGMMDHHQMAIDMASDCLKKAKTEAVVTICKNVIDAQTAEINTMHGWLAAWYQVDYNPMPMSHMMDMMQKHDSHSSMMGGMNMGSMMQSTATPGMGGMMQMPDDMPMMMGMMAGLSKLEGTEYEIAWLEAMIDHHDDAVHMSNRILKNAEHQELRDLANTIITDQTAEIEAMETLITTFAK